MTRPEYKLAPLTAANLKEVLVGTTPGEWRPCTCDVCGLIWSKDADAIILSATLTEDDAIRIPQSAAPKNRSAIAYLMSHTKELIELLEEREERQRQAQLAVNTPIK